MPRPPARQAITPAPAGGPQPNRQRSNAIEGVAIGRIVHYHGNDGRVRPAIIVAVHRNGTVNLQVFEDGPACPRWENWVMPAETVPPFAGAPRFWSWPPPA